MTVKWKNFSLFEITPIGNNALGESLESVQVVVEWDITLACSRHYLADRDEYATP